MKKENQVIGKVIKVKKLWWLKINKKPIRVTPGDGATFPLSLQVNYNVDGNEYIDKKIVSWNEKDIQVNQEVTVTYNIDKPQRILKAIFHLFIGIIDKK